MKIKKLVVFLIFLMIITNNVLGLGISPAKTKIDYEPGKELNIGFSVFHTSEDSKLYIKASGDFAEYVNISKKTLKGPEGFSITLKLPDYTEKYGRNKLYIQVGEESTKEKGISVLVKVGALIEIKVPYPGKYAELSNFNIENINYGEPLEISADVENMGSEKIVANVNIDIYSNDKFIKSIPLGYDIMDLRSKKTFQKIINNPGLKPGSYHAIATLDYFGNETKKAEADFRVGNLKVSIINWTKEITSGKINKYFLDIKSMWNNDIENVYAEVEINKERQNLTKFKTPSVKLKKWEEERLIGYLDASLLPAGDYEANISLVYNKNITNKIVKLKILEPGFLESLNITTMIVLIISIVVLTIAIIVGLYLILKKDRKK